GVEDYRQGRKPWVWITSFVGQHWFTVVSFLAGFGLFVAQRRGLLFWRRTSPTEEPSARTPGSESAAAADRLPDELRQLFADCAAFEDEVGHAQPPANPDMTRRLKRRLLDQHVNLRRKARTVQRSLGERFHGDFTLVYTYLGRIAMEIDRLQP